MTSGEKADRVAAFLVSILGAVAIAIAFAVSHAQIAHAASSAEVALTALMQKLSEVRAAGGKFTERKYFSILDEPLVLKGTVRYRAPDYVRKKYHDPDSESYELRGNNLTIELADGRRRDLSIDDHPVLRAFVESYRGTLAGDLERLRRYFELQLGGRIDAWQLRLTPRTPEQAERLRAVVMRGREGTLTSVETLEASGDRSVMTLDPAVE